MATNSQIVTLDDEPSTAAPQSEQQLAKLAVLAWEGVADDKGKPAAVTPEGVAALMEHWLLADAFEREYLAGLYSLDAEKNA